MESYPDPTLPSRPPSYPYFLDYVSAPESHEHHQNDNFAPSQQNSSSHHFSGNFEDDVRRAEASKLPLGTTAHHFDTSDGIVAAYSMSPPTLPLLRKRRQKALQREPSKRQRLPAVGVFRPPQPPKPRLRSPLRAIKNTQNLEFTAKKQEKTHPAHENTRDQTKSTIFYKENRQGKLVIQKYSHQRTGGVTAVRHKPPSTSQDQDQRGIKSLALPVAPSSLAPHAQEPTSHKYLHNLYRAFKRDFEDSSLPRTNHLAKTINPADLNLSMDNSQNQRGPAPSTSAPIQPQNNVIWQFRAPEHQPHPGQQYVEIRNIIISGEQRGLASRANYNADVPGKEKAEKGNGHGVREFVELLNVEGRNDAMRERENQERSMTSPRFADPPLAEIDTVPDASRASAGPLGGKDASVGVSAPSASASEGGRDDSSSIANETRSESPLSPSFDEEVTGNHQQHQNPFAFAPGEHLAHPHFSSSRWDGRDLTGFPVHLPDHGPKAQQALWSAYTSAQQPYDDSVGVGAWGCEFDGWLLPQGMMGGAGTWQMEEYW